MPEGKKNCTCDKTTGKWTDCTDITTGETECPANMPEGKEKCTCNKTTGVWENCQDIVTEIECPTDMPQGKEDCSCDKTTGEWTDCKDADKNGNHLKDSKEAETIALAKECITHLSCSSGYCDSFIGKCSTPCNETIDCMDGFICRPDGRCAAEAFETVWKITTPNEVLTMPMSTGICDFKIDWGDGSAVEEYHKCPEYGKLTHKYKMAGEKHVKITGTYSDWCMGEGNISSDCMPKDDVLKLIKVVSYGPVGLGNNAFASAKNLASLPTLDIPDATLLGCRQKNTESCGEIWNMFYSCEKLHSGVSLWDMSMVKEIHNMFAFAKNYNESLKNWDVSNITNMSGMFMYAENFNGAIDKWDTGKVTSMANMFEGATKFTQLLEWNTQNVKNMNSMFKGAINAKSPHSAWNLSSVTDMADMFNGATAYDAFYKVGNPETPAVNIKSCDKVKRLFEGTAYHCDNVNTILKQIFPNLPSTCTAKDLKSTCN